MPGLRFGLGRPDVTMIVAPVDSMPEGPCGPWRWRFPGFWSKPIELWRDCLGVSSSTFVTTQAMPLQHAARNPVRGSIIVETHVCLRRRCSSAGILKVVIGRASCWRGRARGLLVPSIG